MAGAQPHHADAQGALARLFGPGELVAVPIQPQRPERPRPEQAHHRPAPGVVDPALGLVLEGARGGGDDAGELFALLGQAVDHLQRRILPQDAQDLALLARPHVQHQRSPRHRAGGCGGDGPPLVGIGTARELLAFQAQ